MLGWVLFVFLFVCCSLVRRGEGLLASVRRWREGGGNGAVAAAAVAAAVPRETGAARLVGGRHAPPPNCSILYGEADRLIAMCALVRSARAGVALYIYVVCTFFFSSPFDRDSAPPRKEDGRRIREGRRLKMKAAMFVVVTLVVLLQSVDARPVVSSDRSLIGKIQKRVEVEQVHRSSSLVGIITTIVLVY